MRKVANPLATCFVILSALSPVGGIQAPTQQSQWHSGSHFFLKPWEQRVSQLDVGQGPDDLSGPDLMPARRRELHFGHDSVTFSCVMVLTMQCMVIHTSLSVCRNTDELSGETEPSLLTQTLTVAARSIVYPPMMCMLFVACRLYVLATTEGYGEPQVWVKLCMLTATFGMTLQFGLVLILPMFTTHWSAKEDETGIRFEDLAGEAAGVHVQLESMRFIDEDHRATFESVQVLAIAFIYCGIMGVTLGIFTFPPGTTKVSTAVISTVFLTVLYFGVYFLLWLGNLMGMEAYEFRSGARQALLPIRKIPMICVLFLASRMRALQLDPPHGMPSHFEQLAFIAICGALFLEALAALLIGATGEEQTGSYGVPIYKSSEISNASMHFAGFVVYCGLVPVVYGMFVARGADGIGGHPFSSTVSAVLQLATLYFVVSFMQWCVFMLEDLNETKFPDAKAVVLAADVSVRLCPLISILFVACRLRALQLTQQQGSPQIWAQQAMFMSVFAMGAQMVTCLILPLVMGSAAPVDGDGCADWNLKPLLAAYVVTVMKYIALFCLHGGALMVSIAILVMTPETASQPTGHAVLRFSVEREIMGECLLASLVSFGFALFFSFGKVLGIIFKLVVEDFDKQLIGCEMTVRKAGVGLLRGWVNIADVVVQNPDFPAEDGPASWSTPYLMKVKRVRADLDMVKLVKSGGQVFDFEEILLEGVHINYVKPWMLKDNVTCILDHIHNNKNKQSIPDVEQPLEKPLGAEEAQLKKGVKVVFHKIKIVGVTAEVFVSGPSGLGGQMHVALADLVFPDFDEQHSNKADPTIMCDNKAEQELLKFIVRSLMETVAANVGPGKHIKGAVKGVADAAKKVSTCLQGVNPCFNGGNASLSLKRSHAQEKLAAAKPLPEGR